MEPTPENIHNMEASYLLETDANRFEEYVQSLHLTGGALQCRNVRPLSDMTAPSETGLPDCFSVSPSSHDRLPRLKRKSTQDCCYDDDENIERRGGSNRRVLRPGGRFSRLGIDENMSALHVSSHASDMASSTLDEV